MPDRINYTAPLTRMLTRSGLFAEDPFILVDVGASGGIEDHWRAFAPHLHAYGFDPLVKECQRLTAEESSPNIRYFDYYVGYEKYGDLYPASIPADPVLGWHTDPYGRSSAVRAQQLLSMSFTQRFNYGDPQIVLTERRTSLDAFFAGHPARTIDFVKIDTDGHDYEVLCGAREIIKSKQVLGFFVECQLHGVNHPHANLFANIDGLLRNAGYSLFDIEVYRYTRKELPGQFLYTIPAQTVDGPVVWGDALYVRDLAAPRYSERWNFKIETPKLLKLLCLFELFKLPDCAAELLYAFAGRLEKYLEKDRCMELLAAQSAFPSDRYAAIMKRFGDDPTAFYPARSAPLPSSAPGDLALIEKLRNELRTIRNSNSWRITAPLRAFRHFLPRTGKN